MVLVVVMSWFGWDGIDGKESLVFLPAMTTEGLSASV
jgi:hypothetical protein